MNKVRIALLGHTSTHESVSLGPFSKIEAETPAEQQLRAGLRLVLGGFCVATLGIVGYLFASLNAATSSGRDFLVLLQPRGAAGIALGAIGLGTVFWLVGAFLYLSTEIELSEEIDGDPTET